jgi:hypothetical protein
MQVDILGREIKIGDCVTYDREVFKITRFTAKMVEIERFKSRYKNKKLVYAADVTIVPEEAVTFWLLKQ